MKYNLADQLLTDELRKGNLVALEMIYSRYHSILYKYSFQFLKDIQITEQAIQDVFIEIWRYRENFPTPIRSLKTYLFISLRKKVFPLFHYQQQNTVDTSLCEHLGILPNDTTEIEQEPPLNCYQLLLQHQEALFLFREDFTIEDIAKIMRIPKESVQRLLC